MQTIAREGGDKNPELKPLVPLLGDGPHAASSADADRVEDYVLLHDTTKGKAGFFSFSLTKIPEEASGQQPQCFSRPLSMNRNYLKHYREIPGFKEMDSKTCAMLSFNGEGFAADTAMQVKAGDRFSLSVLFNVTRGEQPIVLMQGEFTCPCDETLATMHEISPYRAPEQGQKILVQPHINLVRVVGYEGKVFVAGISAFLTIDT